MTAIALTGVTKTFSRERDASPVLKGIDLIIEPGDMVALIGPSGSGKSTLMRHLSGLTLADRNSQGDVRVLGRSIQRQGRLERDIRQSRAQIGHVFQQFNLVGRLSVMKNVLIGGLSRVPSRRGLLGWFTESEKRAALDALERVGLREFALKRATELSGGQQQRVAIARALMQQARVILADEPIASLDPESSRRVMQTLRDINQRDGITVVVTLHQVDYAQQYCRRAVALRQGEIVFDDQINALNETQIRALYGSDQPVTEVQNIPSRVLPSDRRLALA
ncbi:MAG: phosphonate ABC transporter ATP-binding protein [Sedimenticola sp.]|nr:phosphonate ABC transporter ATP-binding protein [Sedimenticola sp.]